MYADDCQVDLEGAAVSYPAESIGKIKIIIAAGESAGDQARSHGPEELYRDIRRVGGVIMRVPRTGADATKGIPDAFYLTLPTVVALREVAGVVKAWLHDRPRTVEITKMKDGKVLDEYRVTGAVSDASLNEILRNAVERER